MELDNGCCLSLYNNIYTKYTFRYFNFNLKTTEIPEIR